MAARLAYISPRHGSKSIAARREFANPVARRLLDSNSLPCSFVCLFVSVAQSNSILTGARIFHASRFANAKSLVSTDLGIKTQLKHN